MFFDVCKIKQSNKKIFENQIYLNTPYDCLKMLFH